MTDEGVFPKVDGDIYYASEVNATPLKLIGQKIEVSYSPGSTTSPQIVGGSLVYYGTNIGSRISNFFHIKTTFFKPETLSLWGAMVVMSGAGLSGLPIGSGQPSTDGFYKSTSMWDIDYILTSGAITANGGNIGSDYVFTRYVRLDASVGIYNNNFLIYGH